MKKEIKLILAMAICLLIVPNTFSQDFTHSEESMEYAKEEVDSDNFSDKDCIKMSVGQRGDKSIRRDKVVGYHYLVAFKNTCDYGITVTMYSEDINGETKSCCIQVKAHNSNTGNIITSSTGKVTFKVTSTW